MIAAAQVAPRRPRILVVDDEDDLLDVLEYELTDAGYDVTCAHDAREALARTAQQDFDLVLTDLKMPGMDGLELLRVLQRAQPGFGAIVMTGFVSEEVRATLDAWEHQYLAKPFGIEELLSAIRGELSLMSQTRPALELRRTRGA